MRRAATKLYSYFEWQRGTEYRNGNGCSGVASHGNINWVRENWVATQDITHVFSPTLPGDFKFSFSRYYTQTPGGDLAAAVNPSTIGLTMPLPGTTTQEDLPEIGVNDNWSAGVIGGGTVFGNEPGAEATNSIGFFEGQPVFAIYGQDDWRVNHRLSLNLGLRYDVQRGLRERHDHLNRGLCLTCVSPITNDSTYQANIANAANQSGWIAANVPVPTTVYGGVLFARDNGQSRDAYDTDFTNIGPRVGFAYAVSPTTVFRGGFGIMYSFGLEGGSSIGQYQSTQYLTTEDNNNPTTSFQQGSPFPSGLIKPAGNTNGLLTDVGQCCLQVDFPGRKIPREKIFSFGMQHEFPGAVVLDARYAANYTSKLRTFLWINGAASLAAQRGPGRALYLEPAGSKSLLQRALNGRRRLWHIHYCASNRPDFAAFAIWFARW